MWRISWHFLISIIRITEAGNAIACFLVVVITSPWEDTNLGKMRLWQWFLPCGDQSSAGINNLVYLDI